MTRATFRALHNVCAAARGLQQHSSLEKEVFSGLCYCGIVSRKTKERLLLASLEAVCHHWWTQWRLCLKLCMKMHFSSCVYMKKSILKWICCLCHIQILYIAGRDGLMHLPTCGWECQVSEQFRTLVRCHFSWSLLSPSALNWKAEVKYVLPPVVQAGAAVWCIVCSCTVVSHHSDVTGSCIKNTFNFTYLISPSLSAAHRLLSKLLIYQYHDVTPLQPSLQTGSSHRKSLSVYSLYLCILQSKGGKVH